MTFNEQYLQELWNTHFSWNLNVLFNDIKKVKTANLYLSEIPGEYYNFAVPNVLNPNDLNVAEVENNMMVNNKKPSYVLHASHQQAGFTELLIRRGYKSQGGDCWVVLDKGAYHKEQLETCVVEITPDTFKDYYNVLSLVFSDFPGNEKYLELCLKSIKEPLISRYTDLVSKLFVIYEAEKPVSGAGLFYSKEADAAYLHDGGTLKEHRNRGYQTALLKHRTNIALSEGIKRIYSSVEPGSQSWSNCIKVGFCQTPWSLLLVKDSNINSV